MDLKFKDNSQYAQLEYIKNTGTQYIDSGILTSTNLIIEFEASDFVNNKATMVVGARVANSNSSVMFQTGANINLGACIQYKSSEWSNDIIPLSEMVSSVKIKYTVVCDNNNMRVYKNDVYVTQITNTSTNFTPLSLAIFGLNTNGTIRPTEGNCKLYSLKIKQNNIVVRDFIPVKDHDDVVCLYDTVSETLFYNQGTGDFIAGPEVPCTIIRLPETILLKTTTLYHKNTPNVDGLQLLNTILNYQKTHQDEIKEYYYPTTQLWQDIITEYPDIVQYYDMNHKLCIPICEADDPEQYVEDFLTAVNSIRQELEDYPDLIPVIAEYPVVASVIVENPEVVHSVVDTGYETWLHNNGTAYLTTQLRFPSGIRLCGKFYFISLVNDNYISIAGTYNGKHNILRVYQGPKLQICINSCASSTDRLEYNISLNTKYDLDLSNRASAYIKNSGSIVASANFSGDIAPTPIAIFAITRYDSSSDMQVGTLKASTIKLYDINDNVVLWLAPIQNNGNPCMIDLLTGTKYLNQGTGSFTYSLEPKNA